LAVVEINYPNGVGVEGYMNYSDKQPTDDLNNDARAFLLAQGFFQESTSWAVLFRNINKFQEAPLQQ
jgi:hypothetical protein